MQAASPQRMVNSGNRKTLRVRGTPMEEISKLLKPGIPASAKIFGWILALAGLFFAYVYIFIPGSFFPGVDLATFSAQFGLYSTGVRILGSVLGIIIALALNSAALLALMLTTRLFIELGDVIVGLVVNNGAPDSNTITLIALAAVELFFTIRLVRVLLKLK
jgi:hypothetical protein